ncbi:nectin-3 isoform X1 [Misgurnus anguillicaudatus]|uniref:nectin-3 isoform X1 n=2 Tax=Misgurnus anguillicaudatus TaxID=75329 RepID=UPI003CCFA819
MRLITCYVFVRLQFALGILNRTAVPPLVYVTGKSHVCDRSEVTLASCFASYVRPAAEVIWRFGDHIHTLRTETDYMVHPDGSFTVVSHLLGAPLKHLNQERIQCVVTHSTLTKTHKHDYTINVHYPPELVTIIPDDPKRPEKFSCLADSNPRPTSYTWIKLNESIPHSEANTLYVSKLSSDFNGVYICKVSNQYGSASGVIYVNNQTESTFACWSLYSFAFSFIVLCICGGCMLLKNASGTRQPIRKRSRGGVFVLQILS